MPSGTPPNTSIVLTEAEIEFVNRRFAGSKSAAIHAALEEIMSQSTVTITNPTRTRKLGWGYSTTPERNSTRIVPPSTPDYTGTYASITRQISEDRTFQSLVSGGTFINTRWFYDGKVIVNADEFLWAMNEIYVDRDAAKSGWGSNRPEVVTVITE